MLKTINKTTLFVTMAFVSGSFLKANEPVLALGTPQIDGTSVVEAYEPTTLISAEDLQKAKLKAFLGDLGGLVAKHKLSKDDVKIMVAEGAASLALVFSDHNGLSEKDTLEAVDSIIEEIKTISNLHWQLLECAGCKPFNDNDKEIILGKPAADVIRANRTGEFGIRDCALVSAKVIQDVLKTKVQFIAPMSLLLYHLPNLPVNIKLEVINLLLLNQFPALKGILKFEICDSHGINPEFVISWVSEQVDKIIHGSEDESRDAILALENALERVTNSIDSLFTYTFNIQNRFNAVVKPSLLHNRSRQEVIVMDVDKAKNFLNGLVFKVFGKSPELLGEFTAVVQAIE